MIVHHYHVEAVARIILRQHRPQAGADIGFLVAGRNDDADVRRALRERRRHALEPGEEPALLDGSRNQPRHDREP